MTESISQSAPLKSVLYVDDEPDIREVVEMSLNLVPGVAVKTCGSGAAALQLLPSFLPDLVLLDVMMPGLDGPATLARMRNDAALKHIPVVFMTAKALPQEVDRFMSLGAVGVISKPFDPMQLATRVQEIWRSCAIQSAAAIGPI
jgi:two-component system, OmpR family, response regulator